MCRRNRYDFDDMINWVIKAFTENSTLLASYQERFQYILVDEYQDTSGTQNRLVELLISRGSNQYFVVALLFRHLPLRRIRTTSYQAYKNDFTNGSAYQQLSFYTADPRCIQNTYRQK